MPDIRSIPTVLTELNIVAMPILAILEYKNQFMLTTIKRSHASVVLNPDAQILEFRVDLPARDQQFVNMPPIHKNVVNRPVHGMRYQQPAYSGEKVDKFRLGHFARCHGEVLVLN